MNHRLRRTVPAAAAALLLTGALAGCGDGSDGAQDPSVGGATTTTAPATTSAAATPTTSAAAATETARVYWIGKTPMGNRLYAENDPATAGQSPTAAALGSLLRAQPTDPDYRSAVPPQSIKAVTVQPGHDIEVQLTSATWTKAAAGGIDPADVDLAVQQIVFTFNAAAGSKRPLPVHFTLNGEPSTFLGRPSVARAAVPTRILSLMNVLSPAEGAELVAGPTTFSGMANSFEANVAWSITDQNGKKVLHGATMADGWMDSQLHPWKARIDLSKLGAGSYTFEASTGDGGEGEGSGPFTDDKSFTIGS